MKVLPQILPRATTSSKLFITGATVGPVVDSLHNQCLLTYGIAPISIPWPSFTMPTDAAAAAAAASDATVTSSYLFCSSWLVPPLLGVAYVVLGGVLPRLMQILIDNVSNVNDDASTISNNNGINTFTGNKTKDTRKGFFLRWKDKLSSPLQKLSKINIKIEENNNDGENRQYQTGMRNRALVAVLSTALIIKLSEFLETQQLDAFVTNTNLDIGMSNLIIMLFAALAQWATLDGTIAALLAATVTSIGGPLSELPFVASGCWSYLPEAADYLPLSQGTALGDIVGIFASGGGGDYRDLALSSITGPCYFAVTMDAIALGRWFDADDDIM
uniref:Uncharacterized protein n=1 Tax=Ditylum brightwellii TaxID=49249 RepID=A0A7S4QBJ3_9STRA